MRLPSPMPIRRTCGGELLGGAAACGAGGLLSAMSSMSKNSAPGICSIRNSAWALRRSVGRCTRGVEDDEVGRVEVRGQPVGRHQPRGRSACSSSSSSGEARRMRRFCLPFFSILPTATRPISPVAAHGCRRRAAGRRAALADDDEAHPAGAARRLHRHGADQAGIGRELRVGDPALGDRMVGGDQRVELGVSSSLSTAAGVLDVEVEPALRRRRSGRR